MFLKSNVDGYNLYTFVKWKEQNMTFLHLYKLVITSNFKYHY